MDKAALVSIDIEKGAEILKKLDEAGLNVKVALWSYFPEYEEWRLVLAARRFDEIGRFDAYGLLHDSLDQRGIRLDDTPAVMIMDMNDPFIKTLRRSFGKAKSVEGMRLGGQTFGDRFLEDAYAYRIS
jgi:hypothetical protein